MIQERAEVAEQHTEMDANPPLGTADLAARAQSDKQLAKSTPETTETAERVALFPEHELGDYRRRWQDVQGSFVDDPRIAVRTADELVASLMSRLAQLFADERAKLEHDWDSGENVSTEDLRVALRRYRSFFDRLLSV